MTAGGIAVAAAAVVVWLLVSARAERANVSSALALVVFGVLAANGPWAIVHGELHAESIKVLAEAALTLVLFGDASRVSPRALRSDAALPGRLLGVGLPLTIFVGVAVAALVLSGTSLWVAAAIAAIVAPTDAALGAPILVDRRVPERIRRALNVESGLNDGIATPIVNVCLAAAVAGSLGGSHGVRTAVAHLVVGAAFGVVVGWGGGMLLRLAHRAQLMAASARPLAVLALAALSYCGAVAVHGNGFIAAFVAGMAFGSTVADEEAEVTTLTEEVAGGLTLLVWFVFGAVLLGPAIRHARPADVAFALLALTVVRMVPVAIALMGSGLDRATVGVVGWFGPRGLASVVFTLIAVDSLGEADGQRVLSAVGITVALSVLAHGVSASPVAAWYGHRGTDGGTDGPELRARARRLAAPEAPAT